MATSDEERTLEDLDKLREQVLQASAERRRVEEAFDAFTSGFRTRQAQRDSEPPLVPPPLPEANAPEMVSGASLGIVRPKRVRRVSGRALAFAGAAVVGAAIFAAARWGQPSPEVTTPAETPAAAAITLQTPPPVPVPIAKPPASSQVGTPGVNVELTTRRRVWMRVTLDGQRAFEREVPADQHIPLHADRSILIRAGDAGAVAIRRNGRDAGPLGRDGVVGTREFTIDATSRQ